MSEEETITKGTVAYWRGTVDQRLDSLDSRVEEVCRKMDRIENKIDVVTTGQGLGNAALAGLTDRENDYIIYGARFITWEFIREKFTVPIILAAILFFLFSILPALLIVIYLVLGKTP
jgi:hypothetical protein